MSTLMSQARTRMPRSARAAVERARLTVVPVRRSRAPRMPFAILVSLLLATGVVGLLMFNTQMQQASFHASALEEKADRLSAQQESLAMQLEGLRSPQHLAQRARRLGMVAPSVPAFIRLSDGRIVGSPVAATPEDAVPITGAPLPKPASLDPAPLVVTVQPERQAREKTQEKTQEKAREKTQERTRDGARSGTATDGGSAGTNGGQTDATEGTSR